MRLSDFSRFSVRESCPLRQCSGAPIVKDWKHRYVYSSLWNNNKTNKQHHHQQTDLDSVLPQMCYNVRVKLYGFGSHYTKASGWQSHDAGQHALYWQSAGSLPAIQTDSLVQFKMVSMCSEKAHMRSTPSLRGFPNVAFETLPTFVWLTMALARPFKEDCPALPLSTHHSTRRSVVWCPWLCSRR